MNDSTLISNLPDRTNGAPTHNHFSNTPETNANTYTPMNVHSSPYGFKNDINPEETVQHRLPSRDIPINQTDYTQDEAIQANYIEEPKNIQDYIQDYKEEESERIRKHNNEKNQVSRLDRAISDVQEFLLIAILYFISDMTIVNTLIKKYLSFLHLSEIDGNFNSYGKVFKSVSFAFIYYISFQAINSSFPTI
jgi:hypothetical protein